jgi:hypothetical protein
MSKQRRILAGPFTVEASKLSRLVQVATETLDASTVAAEYTLTVGGASISDVKTLDDVLAFDNTRTRSVTGLHIKLSDAQKSKVEVDMQGGSTPRITLDVSSGSHRFVTETFAKVEEQAERFMHVGFEKFGAALPAIATIAGVVGLFAFLFTLGRKTPLTADKLWLREEELGPLLEKLKRAGAGVPELLEMHRRQLENLANPADGAPIAASTWALMALLAFLFLVVCFILPCYPSSAFLWGDGVTRHDRLVKRRDYLWKTFFVGTLLGVLSRFVFAYIGR